MALLHPLEVAPVPGGATEQLWSARFFGVFFLVFSEVIKREVKRKVVVSCVQVLFFVCLGLGMVVFLGGPMKVVGNNKLLGVVYASGKFFELKNDF